MSVIPVVGRTHSAQNSSRTGKLHTWIRGNNVIAFSGVKHYLSIIHISPFIVNGIRFDSVEHYYQYVKLVELLNKTEAGALIQRNLMTTEVRKTTKEILHKHNISEKDQQAWKDRRAPAVLFDGIKAKFDQNPEVKSRLLMTGHRLLVNTFSGDEVFTSGSSQPDFQKWIQTQNSRIDLPENMQCMNSTEFPRVHRGRNVLGFLLMELRRYYISTPSENTFTPSTYLNMTPTYYHPVPINGTRSMAYREDPPQNHSYNHSPFSTNIYNQRHSYYPAGYQGGNQQTVQYNMAYNTSVYGQAVRNTAQSYRNLINVSAQTTRF